MDKKIKKKTMLIAFLVLLYSLFVPAHTVYAYFSDTISEDAGIELTLGSIELAAKEDSNNDVLTLKNGQNKIQLKETIQNKGTLTGKLAYKIKLTKNDGNELDENLKNSIKIKLNTTEVKIQNDYELLSNKSGDQIILDPSSYTDVQIDVETTSLPEQTEKITLQIDFLLFQTNGTLENPLFHDKLTKVYDITLNKKEAEKPDDYWPTTGWIDHGNVRYNKEDYSPVMYFSEIKGSRKVKNLNDIVFYVDTKDSVGFNLNKLEFYIDDSLDIFSIKYEHVNKNNQHLKITLSIDETKFKENAVSTSIYYYAIKYNKQNILTSNEAPLKLKRILLSTDEAGERHFNVRPINLFAEEREFFLAQAEIDYSISYNDNLSKPLSKISFNKSPKISVEVSGENKDLVDVKKIQTEENSFSLKPKSKTETKETEAALSILLEGTSGEILEVKRNIQILSTASETAWPQGMSTIWGTPDGEGNYGNKLNVDLQVVDNKFVSKNSMSIYVKNPYKEELHYIPPDSDSFVSQQPILYSPDGEYLKIDLNFISKILEEYSLPHSFNFSIVREKNINNYTGYINNEPVYVQYIMPKNPAQSSQNKMAVEEVSTNTEVSYEVPLLQAVTNGEKELYIEYTQLPSDFDVAKVEEDIRNLMANKGVENDFTIKDDPELKAIKITVQE